MAAAVEKMADAFVEIDKYLFGYPAGKARLTSKLLPLVPGHRVYTECFCGSAAVFFDKEAAPVEALVDRDTEVVAALRAVRSLTKADLATLERANWIGARRTFDKLKKLKPSGRIELLHRFLYLTLFGFRRARKSYAPDMDDRDAGPGINRRLAKSRARMHRGVKIFSGDYEAVVRQFDAPDAFHFLDPPYPGYDVGVGEKEFDEVRFRNLLDSIKGKFLITYGVRGKLKLDGFKVRKISPRRYLSSERGNKGPAALDTLLIANYDFKMASLDLGSEWGEEITVSDNDAAELAHLGAITRSTAAWLSTFVRKCARYSQAGSVRELAKAIEPVDQLAQTLTGFGDLPLLDVPTNPEHAALALSSALKASSSADLPEILKEQSADADAGLAQFLAALHVLGELDNGDPPASVGKLAISEISAKLLREVGDEDLGKAHSQIHQLFAGNFAGNESAFTGGMRRYDLVEAELAVQMEMKRRGLPHEVQDALTAEASRIMQAMKGDISTESFPIVPGQGDRFRDLPAGLKQPEDEDEDEIKKRVLTTAERNDFPDSSFLYIGPGGDKDGDGKTVPRSLRMFPVRDKNGKALLPQIRNALARVPQSDIPQAIKDRVAAQAQRMLEDATKRSQSAKRDDPMFDVPANEEPQIGTIQYHFHGRSMHADFRAQVDGHLIGWTLGSERGGMLGDGVQTLKRARALGKSFSFSGDRYVRSMCEPGSVSATPKLRQSTAWLDASAEVFNEFEPGATALDKGVLVEVAKLQVEFGVQSDELHEYFLASDDVSGVLAVRKVDGDWRASIVASNLPAVLRKGAELPPAGRSSLPRSLCADVPHEFRYWLERGEVAKRMHRALVESQIFNDGNVRIVGGDLRRTVHKVFLASVDDEPAVAPMPWVERVALALGDGKVIESFGALRKQSGATAYYDAGCNPIESVVDAAFAMDAPYVISAKDSPEARDALSRVGEVFKFVPDRSTALDALERIFVASLPIVRTSGVKFLHHAVKTDASAIDEMITDPFVKSLLAREIPLLKTADERFVLGIVLEPEVRDAQGDIYSEDEVRTAAHSFMEQFQNIGLMHQELINDKVSILESSVTLVDMVLDGETVKKGTWLFATRINDGAMWGDIKSGKLGGYSIGGSAVRVPEKRQD